MQDTAATETKSLISIEELTPDEKHLLMQDLLTLVIAINFMVFVSMILCT